MFKTLVATLTAVSASALDRDKTSLPKGPEPVAAAEVPQAADSASDDSADRRLVDQALEELLELLRTASNSETPSVKVTSLGQTPALDRQATACASNESGKTTVKTGEKPATANAEPKDSSSIPLLIEFTGEDEAREDEVRDAVLKHFLAMNAGVYGPQGL
jgi:hypothetical protein